MDLLRVDVSQQRARREPLPERYAVYGGRGLSAAILLAEVPPTCDPLGPQNKLVIAPGRLAARGISSAGRLSIGGKSPLTGGIKESNSGGNMASALVRLGLAVVIVEDAPADGRLWILRIGEDGAEFVPAEEYRGLGTYAATAALRARFGPGCCLAVLGPAGEARRKAAGIALTDNDGIPGRSAARGGLGALMGAKGLKAIVVEATRAKPSPPVDVQAFKQGVQRYTAQLREDYHTSTVFPELGTPYMVAPMQKLGALPTRNFRHGQFEQVTELEGNSIRATILQRGGQGKTTHACMAGCVIRCSNVIPDAQGRAIVSPIEYESMVMLGPNLEIGSLDAVAQFNYRCNDLGVDTVDVGGAIGVAMDAGILPFGDVAGVNRLLDEVARGSELGMVIGDGTAAAGRAFGAQRIPVVKGQCIAAYDPRAIKGLGVTYATSPMGADHTAGHTADFPTDHHSREGKVALSRQAQITAAAWDALGLCSFTTGAIAPQMQLVEQMLRALDGGRDGRGAEQAAAYVNRLGLAVLRMERAFNTAAGFTAADDRLPEFFATEPLPPFDVVFDVSDAELDSVFNDEP
ncbi:MAG: aldehyde ferredoxin oxidoreductase [Anaerolineales bacterium]|nr:aldehyde ferredoxin oxidoreductase [Anaerolineales bacterium]